MSKPYDVLVLGGYFLDLIFTGLTQFPELGREVFASGFNMGPGGAYNSVVTMHRLGLRTGWACDFGSDDFSAYVLERARAEGLDPALFVHHDRPLRMISVAASYPQDRAFITFCDPRPDRPAGLDAVGRGLARLVYLPGLYTGPLLGEAGAAARHHGMKLVMDAASGEETLADPHVLRAVRSVDVFMPNATEARRLTGESDAIAAAFALAEFCPLVVVKDGANGAYAVTSGELIHEPAIAVHCIDTTGAGDCFNAGFLKAWLDGRPLRECLRWANVVGGLSTTAHGGPGYTVTLAEVERRLA